MRTLTTAQEAALSARDYSVHVRVLVADRTGTLQDLSALEGINWVDRVTWGDVVDAPVSQATVYLRRDVEDMVLSLSPFRTDSDLNEVDGSNFYSLLDMGRRMQIQVAVLALSATPGGSDWVIVWDGEIDSVGWGQTPVEVVGRDGSAGAQDRWIETPTPYGLDAGRAIHLVMQDILDAWAPSYTLVVPEAPGFLITTYTQTQQPVLEALRVLAGLIGWNVKWRWDPVGGQFALMFYEPDRLATEPAWTFGPSHYLDVVRLEVDRTNVRNVVQVSYLDAATDERATVSVESASSIARYGRRWMELEESDESPIDTLAEATALAEAALADLSEPLAEQEIETLFWWPGELEDVLRFAANGVHYNGPRDLAIVGMRHELSQDRHRTYITTRGRPVGLFRGWLDRPLPPVPVRPRLLIFPTIDAAGNVSARLVGDEPTRSIRVIAWREGEEPGNIEATVRAETAFNGREIPPATVGTLVTASTAPQWIYLAGFPYSDIDAGGREGRLARAEILYQTPGVPPESDPPLIIVDRPYRCSTAHRGYVLSRDRLATNPLNADLTDPSAWITALVTGNLPGDLLPWQPFPGQSQKNFAAIGYNPLTDSLLVSGGNAGTIAEVPPTDPYFIRSRNGGSTWEGFFNPGWGSGIDFEGDPYPILPFSSSNGRIHCGDGTWLVVDMRGGWSISVNDGETWSAFQYIPAPTVDEDPAFQPLSLAYGDSGQWAVAGSFFNWDTFTTDVRLFRSVGAHAASGWSGFTTEASVAPQAIAYGNGLWIVGMAGPSSTGRVWRCLGATFEETDFEASGRVVVSTDFQSDVYEGEAGVFTAALVVNEIRYLPRAAGGGRWWIYGSVNALVYSDDDGVTWNKSLCDHLSPTGDTTIHPFLDHRRANAAGYNASSGAHPRITYITQSPDNLDLLIAVGCTYARTEDGITDPLRVFATSTDGGTTWGPVRQVPSPTPIQTAPEPGGWALIRAVAAIGGGGS